MQTRIQGYTHTVNYYSKKKKKTFLLGKDSESTMKCHAQKRHAHRYVYIDNTG